MNDVEFREKYCMDRCPNYTCDPDHPCATPGKCIIDEDDLEEMEEMEDE